LELAQLERDRSGGGEPADGVGVLDLERGGTTLVGGFTSI
jgi:hypothetical protein